MDDSILEHRATPEQLERFDQQGYLVIEDALSPSDVTRLETVVDGIAEAERQRRELH